jgi:hypothetical protein
MSDNPFYDTFRIVLVPRLVFLLSKALVLNSKSPRPIDFVHCKKAVKSIIYLAGDLSIYEPSQYRSSFNLNVRKRLPTIYEIAPPASPRFEPLVRLASVPHNRGCPVVTAAEADHQIATIFQALCLGGVTRLPLWIIVRGTVDVHRGLPVCVKEIRPRLACFDQRLMRHNVVVCP